MILHFEIKIKDLIESGKNYNWPRPACCPICDGRLWGHGYTPRYFIGCPERLWMKRYRCVACHAVHTLRPKTHWRRFQCTLAIIIESLRSKIVDNLWVKSFSRQSQEYWLRGFEMQLAINNPAATACVSLKHLRGLLSKNIIIATHSMRWFRMSVHSGLVCVPEVCAPYP